MTEGKGSKKGKVIIKERKELMQNTKGEERQEKRSKNEKEKREEEEEKGIEVVVLSAKYQLKLLEDGAVANLLWGYAVS